MGLIGSNSGLFRAPGFTVSPVRKGERRKKKGKEGNRNRNGIEGRKEGRRNKKRSEKRRRHIKKRKKDRKEEGIQGESSKGKKKKVFCWL